MRPISLTGFQYLGMDFDVIGVIYDLNLELSSSEGNMFSPEISTHIFAVLWTAFCLLDTLSFALRTSLR